MMTFLMTTMSDKISTFDKYEPFLKGINSIPSRTRNSSSFIKRLKEIVSEKEEETLVGLMRIADDAYYNDGRETELTQPQLKLVRRLFTDKVYDSIFSYVKETYPTNEYVSFKVGAPVSKASGKQKLPAFCGSLNKVKPENLQTWVNNHQGPYVLSEKEDGNSGLFQVKNKKVYLWTRGDGTFGQNISHLVPYITGFPTDLPDMIGRGELIMSEATFQKYKKEKANARNHVAGILNSIEVNTAANDIDFLAYEIIEPRLTPSEQFKKLGELGFKTPWWKEEKEIDAIYLSNLLTERKTSSLYAIDGIVITQDTSNPVNMVGNPTYSVAFKDVNLLKTAETEVLGVEWNVSKYGFIKPVVLLQPISLDGVEIKRATGFNAKFIYDNKIGKGAVVKIVRSGQVIPHIEEVIKQAEEADMPKEEYAWSESLVDIYLKNTSNNETYHVKKITSFFRALGAKNISTGIISMLYRAKYDSINKILKLSKEKLLKIDGIKEKKADLILNEINSCTKNCPLEDLMYASGTFGSNLGDLRLTSICKAIPNVLELKKAEIEQKILKIPGFSSITVQAFVDGISKFKTFLKRLPDSVTYVGKEEPKKEEAPKLSNKLEGQVICFSGFRDKNLKKIVEENGGSFSDSLTKNVNLLVVKSKDSSSSKAIKAQKLGIKSLDSQEFVDFLYELGISI